jgi:NPCBM-associated, NEW3 domain of alpha-galactosidase.
VFGLLAAGLLTVTAMPMQAAADEEEAQPKMITEAETGKVTFSTDYPGVTVKPGGTSTFTLYITNTGSEEATVELGAEDLPEGWEGRFKGSSNEISMVHVGAYQTKEDSPSLSYSLTVPEDTKEDTYTVSLSAKGGNIDEVLALTVKVDAEEKKIGAGNFTTDYAQQEGVAGTKFSYTTTLTNNSGENMTYSLSAEGAPEGWNVTFTPSGTTTTTSFRTRGCRCKFYNQGCRCSRTECERPVSIRSHLSQPAQVRHSNFRSRSGLQEHTA